MEIAPLVEAVVGFDTRPYARPHFQIAEQPVGAAQPHAGTHTFAPPDLAQVYRFPAGTDGTGQVIGIIELMAAHGSGLPVAWGADAGGERRVRGWGCQQARDQSQLQCP